MVRSNQYYTLSFELFKELEEIFKKGGIKAVAIQFWRYILLYSFLANPLKWILGDILHEKLVRSVTIGYWPRIRSPRSFNEKIMHRKIFSEKDIYSTIGDKWAVRDYVKKKTNEQILNEVYFVTQDPSEIPFDKFPEKFVVKATHGSGWNIIVDNKSQADFEKIRDKCRKWLSQTYVSTANEYWYENINPKIIVEEYISGDEQKLPQDYKFLVFDGDVRYILVDEHKTEEHNRAVFDRTGELMPFSITYPQSNDIELPNQLNQMIDVAETLGEDFDHIRVDLYNTTRLGIIFGELTVAHGSGGSKIRPIEYDFQIGSNWKIRSNSCSSQ